MKKRAFISVYDKVGLSSFVKNLVNNLDYEIVAMGDTYDMLYNANINVTNVNDFVSNSKLLSNDYKVLNKNILASILQNIPNVKSYSEIEQFAVKNFDMVVINLEPFERIASTSSNIDEIMDKVDIVGITLLRAAAKNHKNITVVYDKEDYDIALNANYYSRMKLATKVFNKVADYDRAVSAVISDEIGESLYKTFTLEKVSEMSHGENHHQKAQMYKCENMVSYEVIEDKELSYNDILNVTEATNIVAEFFDVNAVAIVRHTKPCGVAVGKTIYEAYTKAFECDPMSSYYGTIAFSKKVDLDTAKHLNSMAVETIVAPDFDDMAVELLKENTDMKLVILHTSLRDYKKMNVDDIVVTPFGVLIQERNSSELNKDLFKVVTKEKPTVEQIEDAVFGWKIAKYAKTNATIVVKDLKTLSIGQGYTNTVVAIEDVLNMVADSAKDAVLISDCAISAEDSIYAAIQNRIGLIIQPGGTMKDNKLIDLANKYNLPIITTGIRNYTH